MDLTIPVTGKEPAKGFDYSVMDKDTAQFAETKAAEIWARHDRMIDDWTASANDLTVVRDKFVEAARELHRSGKFGGKREETFKQWVERETPYSSKIASSMITTLKRLPPPRDGSQLHRRLPHHTALELTKGGTTPESIIKAVLSRAETEHVGKREAKDINRAARDMVDAELSSPNKANQIARDTGKPQVATDGRLYLGLTPEEVEQGKAENKLDFGIIDGVTFFSSIEISPEEWLAQESSALQEWSVTDPPQIKAASDWLRGLSKAWNDYAKDKAINGESHEDSD